MSPGVRRAAGPAVVLLLFVVHRVLVILSAGDFLHPMEPSEPKNAQIAWDLMTGRFGTDGYGLAAYVANSGSVHHAAFSSTAFVHLLVSKVFGFGILGIRIVPLLFTTGAFALVGWMLLRVAGPMTAALGLLAGTLIPTVFFSFQVTMQGSHPESVLPLAAAIAAWIWFLEAQGPTRGFVLGAALGYAGIFNYLLIPPVTLLAALLLLPPRPRLDRATVLAGVAGLVVGLWPLWLIVGLDPHALAVSVTEQPETTVGHQVLGGGADLALVWRTVWENLPYGFDDFWMHEDGGLWGGQGFEIASYRAMVFGPLALLPFVLVTRSAALRRLALFVALAPPLTYLAIAWSSPFKPYIPPRYLVGLLLVAWMAPALLVAIGHEGLQRPRGRWIGGLGVLLGLAWFGWQGPPRVVEAADAVRLERADAILRHRHLTYYNLGIGTVWASQVDAVNRLIDVRAAEDDPRAFDGVMAGLWLLGARRGLARGDWEQPPFDWPALHSCMNEWREAESYRTGDERARPQRAAENIGWGVAIRLGGDVVAIATLLEDARLSGDWPAELPLESAWVGVGEALHDDPRLFAPTQDGLTNDIPGPYRPAVAAGVQAARARGPVPPATLPLNARSVRGTAT